MISINTNRVDENIDHSVLVSTVCSGIFLLRCFLLVFRSVLIECLILQFLDYLKLIEE